MATLEQLTEGTIVSYRYSTQGWDYYRVEKRDSKHFATFQFLNRELNSETDEIKFVYASKLESSKRKLTPNFIARLHLENLEYKN